MGKGIIQGGGEEGLYSVQIQLETGSIDTEIARLQSQKSALDSQAAGMDPGLERSIVELRAAAVQKRIEYLQDPANVPTNPTVDAWCADLTEDLTGNVGVCEVAGQRENGYNIQPGYEGNAVYDETRDGKLVPAVATGAPHVYWDWAMQGGWQKWKPTYRWGTITEIDYDADTCSVALEEATNPDSGLSVNQAGSLSGVPIEYMSCNSAAFEVGDTVVVKFEGNNWGGARVIGFKEEPKACFGYMVVSIGTMCFVWDFKTGDIAADVHINGDPETMATFPVDQANVSEWIASKNKVAFNTLFSKESFDDDIPVEWIITPISSYDESYECEDIDDGWCEDWGSSTLSTLIGEVTTDLGTSRYELRRTATGTHYANPCGCSVILITYDQTTIVEEVRISGFILTALNGSDDKQLFKVTKTLNSTTTLGSTTEDNISGFQPAPWHCGSPGYWLEALCTTSAFVHSLTESLVANVPMFSIPAKERTANCACSGGGDGKYTCTPTGTVDPAISLPLTIGHAAYYSEDFSVITQLFVYKDEDDNYSAYGQAESGLDDVTVAPSSLAENSALSAALKALADAADDYQPSAQFYN